MEYSEEVITEEEQSILIEWTHLNYRNFILNKNNGGYFIFIDNLNAEIKLNKSSTINGEILKILIEIRERIVNLENLNDSKESNELGHFLYYMESGTRLHRHKDPNDEGTYHIRFNVLIQAPEKGGVPIYAGKKMKQKERHYIICRSGLDYHESTLIEGNKPKMLISYGFAIDSSKTEHFPKIFKNKFITKI
jgi:hypothetical protein